MIEFKVIQNLTTTVEAEIVIAIEILIIFNFIYRFSSEKFN